LILSISVISSFAIDCAIVFFFLLNYSMKKMKFLPKNKNVMKKA